MDSIQTRSENASEFQRPCLTQGQRKVIYFSPERRPGFEDQIRTPLPGKNSEEYSPGIFYTPDITLVLFIPTVFLSPFASKKTRIYVNQEGKTKGNDQAKIRIKNLLYGFTHLLKNVTHKSRDDAFTHYTVSARFLKTGRIYEKIAMR